MKREWIGDRLYRTRQAAIADVREYVAVYYNSKRLHSTPGYTAPMDYEKTLNKVSGICCPLLGKRALRQGEWKILYMPYQKVFEPRPDGIKTDVWQLYNLVKDPAEKHDLSQQFPEKLSEMVRVEFRN